MSTRSFIIQQRGNRFAGVYCHWDGYPEHNGKILFENYATPGSIAALIACGDLSVLGTDLTQCQFYRDRGDCWDIVKPTIRNRMVDLIAIADRSGCEHVYFFNESDWLIASRGSQCFGLSDGTPFSEFHPLSHAISPHHPKAHALAKHLETDVPAIVQEDDERFVTQCEEFLVLTDEEADAAFAAALDAFVEECVLPEIPAHLQFYFDQERWKSDAAFDGRGHSLAAYDGIEREEDDFFIYRLG